ncbi:hypothetical protein ABT025_20850 [Streptomyces sp. NPDC002809]
MSRLSKLEPAGVVATRYDKRGYVFRGTAAAAGRLAIRLRT